MPELEATSAKFPAAYKFLFETFMPDGTTPVRYKIGHSGRGAAKSWSFARALLMLGAALPERTMCAREFQNSIKQSVHRLLADQITHMGMNYLYEVQQAEIKHRQHDTVFFFEGMHGNIEKIKSYERIKRCWIEEGQTTLKDSFEKLDPTLRMGGSEIWVSFNPELESDFIYDFSITKPPADALVRALSWRDNPWFTDVNRRQMEAMRARDFDAYLNIWEGQPKLILAGAVYAEELRATRASGRIGNVPHEPIRPVDVTWDLGHSDKTAIWLTQQVGFELRFIDYYENSQKSLEHYLEWLQARKSSHGQRYIYGMCNLPHDAKAKQLGTKLTVEEQLVAVYGRRNVRVLPRLSLIDGINAARTMFPNCYFDKTRCADGIQALSHYRYEIVDNEKGTLSRVPVHDENSHGADSFRYVAIGRKLPKASVAEMRERLKSRIEDAINGGEMYEHGRPSRGQFNWMGR